MERPVRSHDDLTEMNESSFKLKSMNLCLTHPTIFYEVSARSVDINILFLCSHGLRQLLLSLKEDQLWWFRRTECLLGRSLNCAQSNWRDVYSNLTFCQDRFLEEHNYSNLALVKILFETRELSGNYRSLGCVSSGLAKLCTREVLEYALPRMSLTHDDLMGSAVVDNNPLMIK